MPSPEKSPREGFGLIATRGGRETSRPHAFEWMLVAVVMLYAAFLLIGPLAAIIWGALAEGLSALYQQISSADAISALYLTLMLSLGATIINVIFGVCLALVLVRDEFFGKRMVNGIVDLPFAVSPIVAGLMVILLFGRNGLLTALTDALGIKVVFALPGMLLVTMFVSLPFVVREVMPVLAQIGTDQESAAYTMGATSWQAFWHITLPSIRWALFYGITLTFARSIGEFGAVLVVSGGVSRLTETSTLFIFRSLDDRNYVGAYSMAALLAAISFVVLIVMEIFKKRSLTN